MTSWRCVHKWGRWKEWLRRDFVGSCNWYRLRSRLHLTRVFTATVHWDGRSFIPCILVVKLSTYVLEDHEATSPTIPPSSLTLRTAILGWNVQCLSDPLIYISWRDSKLNILPILELETYELDLSILRSLRGKVFHVRMEWYQIPINLIKIA